ncbi:hypothetical protein O59_001114 [Cellvibrio sp. BR]|jgi:uncharacterized Tic20 family protein|uniref:DUF4870 domain-containing protein n=1 Tax=unclassified Cellvibrio TaxID=2624793 RepID=UPI0002600EE0|nr:MULTISPECIES: DUF4870 domain-containing protein [unclassified Cellvibrio]EIK47093.1 hypothetical protein O59_001114 [Cellvibrio sp. BR]QEY10977.1 DUF4870 domain-containing protein [Cellvibrio sp. KY-YJ-3]UUA71027.1 DUF4870 domain-containing protein [Cellvibrio sp. QJXJ]
MDLEQIEKLNDLKQKGLISEEEYQQAKARILGGQNDKVVQPHTILQTNNYDYAMVLHLTQFCSWLFPFLGLVVPLIMWQSKKEDPYVDEQGKVVMNWVFSSLIYAIVCLILFVVLIGIPMLAALAICSVVFTIMGAMDANKGVIKNYPLTIKFFDVNETPRVISPPL